MEASTILGRLADRNLATNAVATIVDDFKTVLKAQCRLQGEWLQQATELSFAKDQAAKLAEELATAQDVTAQPKVQALEAQVRQHERDLITAYRDKGKLSEELLASRQELAAAQHALEGLQRDLVNERDSRKDAEVQLQEALQALEREKLVAATASGELQARQAEREAAVLECETLKAENQDLISRLVAIKEAEAERRNEEMRMHAELDRRRRELEVLEKAAAVDADNRLGAVLLTGADLSAQDSVPAHAVLRLNGHDGGCFGASFNSAGDRLATCGADRIVRTWEPQSGTQMSELRGLTMTALGVAYTADDRFILACSQDGSIRAWDVRTSRERHVLTGHNQKVVSVHPFYVDASRAVSAGADRCLKIWDLNRGFCTQTLMSHSSPQGAVADQTGSMIVSGHFNGALRFWDLRSGKDIKELSGVHGSGVAIASIAAASSDTGDVISIGRNNAAAIIDVRTYGVRLRLRSDHLRLSYGPVSGCFSPDGRYVAVGSSSGQTVTWRSSDGVVEKVLHGTQDLNHSSQVQCVAWGAGGHIVTGEKNGPAIIWSS